MWHPGTVENTRGNRISSPPIKLTFSVDGSHAGMLQVPCNPLCFDTATPAVDRYQPVSVPTSTAPTGRSVGLRRLVLVWLLQPVAIGYLMTRGYSALSAGKTTVLSAVVPITHGGSRVAPDQRPATLALHHHLIDVERNTICHRPERNTQRPYDHQLFQRAHFFHRHWLRCALPSRRTD